MPLFIWKYKYWIAIAVLSFICFDQLIYTNHLAGKLNESEAKCTAKIEEIEMKQLKALAEKQNLINQVSADYEKSKSEQRGKVETVTLEVQKIVKRPVYLNHCFDDSGLQQLNSLIAGDSSEPP
jgi:hypothetical protein